MITVTDITEEILLIKEDELMMQYEIEELSHYNKFVALLKEHDIPPRQAHALEDAYIQKTMFIKKAFRVGVAFGMNNSKKREPAKSYRPASSEIYNCIH